ncbi:MAG: hypothetical protein HY537_05660 [Deltaproteobacteria bacterium]|nr:hypothetical protein [Deltaproteobacteria bacterium]
MRKSDVWVWAMMFSLITIPCFAKKARTIRLNEQRTEPIYIGTAGSVINFPSRPTKVILGNKGSFAVEYNQDDLAISALRPGAHSNLFVYIDGRRFGFNLLAVGTGGDEIVLIRDAQELKIKAKIRYE